MMPHPSAPSIGTSLAAPDLAPPPGPIALAARVVRRLPRARYRAMNWICRRWRLRPFAAPLPGSATGLRFECDPRNVIAREAFFTGRYEPQETALVTHLLQPGWTFVDVGAHWGYFSLLAAERVGPSGRVLAIEADPRIFGILGRSIGLNAGRLDHVAAIHAAVAGESGSLPFRVIDESQDNWGIARLAPPGEDASTTTLVRAEPLDALLNDAGVRAVDLLKMDIEGAEAAAIRGIRAGLAAGRYHRILLELHPPQIVEYGSTAEAVMADLRAAGYTGWSLPGSAASARRAAYQRHLRPENLLSPLAPGAPLGPWPHQLWTAPGVPSPIPGASP